jgi:hypothetical protein
LNRTKLFTQAFFVMFRSGAGVMWVAALAVAVVDIFFGEVILFSGFVGSLVGLVKGVITGAFLTGVLITAVNSQSDGQPAAISGGIRAGVRPFVPLLLVGLVLTIPGWIMGQITALVSAPMVNLNPTNFDPTNLNSLGSQTSLLLLCCLAPLVLLLDLAVTLLLAAVGVGAERGVALEELGVGAALRRGWNLLRSRFSDLLVIGLIMLAICLVLIILFGCPAVLLLVIANGAAKTPDAIYAASGPYATLISVLVTLVSLPLGIFFSAVWTLTFRRWQGKEDAVPLPNMQPPVELPPIGG